MRDRVVAAGESAARGVDVKGRTPFVRVTTSDYYGRYDSVGGDWLKGRGDQFPIKDRMLIRVKWKSGRVTRETLRLRLGHDSMQIDMNNVPDHFNTREFVVIHTIRGDRIDVPLRGYWIAPA